MPPSERQPPVIKYLEYALQFQESGDYPAEAEALKRAIRALERDDEGDPGLLRIYAYITYNLARLLITLKDIDGALLAFGELINRCQARNVLGGKIYAITNIIGVYVQVKNVAPIAGYAEQLPELFRLKDRKEIEGYQAPPAEMIAEFLTMAVGQAYYDLEDYELTIRLANVAVELHPGLADAWFLLGNANLRLERSAAALEAFDKFVAIDPHNAAVHTSRAAILGQLERYDESIDAISKAIAIRPERAKNWFGRAELLMGAGRNEEALADFGHCITLAQAATRSEEREREQPRTQAQWNRGMPSADLIDFAAVARLGCLRLLGRDEQLMSEATAIIATRDAATKMGAYLCLGDYYLDKGEFSSANEMFTNVIDITSRSTTAWAKRARSRFGLGMIADALDDIYQLCGQAKEQDPAAAIEILSDMLSTDADNIDIRRMLGYALLTDWRPAAAVKELDQVLAVVPNDWQARLWRGLAFVTHGRQGDPEEAAWNERFGQQRLGQSLADLVIAAEQAPAGRPVQMLRWLVDRIVFIPRIYDYLLNDVRHEAGPGFDIQRIIPELGPVFAELLIAREAVEWAAAVESLLRVRELLRPLDMPVFSARVEFFLADNYLRLYEIQRALDFASEAESKFLYFGMFPDMNYDVERYREETVRRLGVSVLTGDADHYELSQQVNFYAMLELRLIKIEAASRLGKQAEAYELLPSVESLTELLLTDVQYNVGFVLNVVPIFRDAGDLDSAFRLTGQLKEVVERRDLTERLTNLEATLYMVQGDLAKAEEILLSEWADLEAGQLEQPEVVRTNLASIAMSRGDYQKAAEYLDYDRDSAGTTLPGQATHHHLRGRLRLKEGQFDLALHELTTSLDLYDRVRETLRTEADRISWQSQWIAIMNSAVQAALSGGRVEQALVLSERAKSRAFVDQLEIGQPRLTEEAAELRRFIEAAQTRQRLLRRLISSPESGDRIELLRELERLGVPLGFGSEVTSEALADLLRRESAAIESLEDRFRASILRERESFAGSVATVEEIKHQLNAGFAEQPVLLAEYFVLDDEVIVFLVREDSADVEWRQVDISGPNWDLSSLRKTHSVRFRQTLKAADAAPLLADIVAPIWSASQPGDSILIVPHGFLQHIPLHAAVIDGMSLAERNPVSYAPSVSVLAQCRARRSGQPSGAGRALVVGDTRGDLPNAKLEARSTATAFGVAPLLGDDATRDAVLRALGDDADPLDVVHFACHGVYDPDHPARSGILLAPGLNERAEDSVLSVEEIYGLRLQAGLVAVSACQSGLGQELPGEELIGLTRAFLYAGSNCVLVTLWSVEDLSARLVMEGFYDQLLGNGTALTRAAALRNAQLRVKDMPVTEVIAEIMTKLRERVGDDDNLDVVNLLLELGRLYTLAGDLSRAISVYEMLQKRGRRVLRVAAAKNLDLRIRLLRFKAEAGVVPDYTVRPFADPYYWAGFALVGDWR